MQYHEQSTSESILKDNIIDSIITEFFGFERYCEKQHILTILKTGRGKSLIYAVASILLQGLTIIFTPQKALMDDQVREMVRMEILAVMLYDSLEQSPLIQEKFLPKLQADYVYNSQGFQFVINEAYCIVSYEGFEIIQSILERPNMKVIRTSIIHHPEITLEIKPKLITKNKLYQIIFDLLDNLERRAIIYEATVIECNDMMKELQKNFDLAIIEMYYGKLTSKEQSIISVNWKNKIIKIMFATLAFEIGWARRSGQQSRAILFYLRSDICTLLTILIIDLQKVHSESSVLTLSCKIVGICENAENIITSIIWQQFLK
ncbi:12984_t:CDS:2 [Funneliformis mosseae]|uniref:DNA 3'-5' helicase n=1 Tax=Funneliformis mosseae TaxID=27381 RepID=A0A9N9FFE5_FUNMO|nr:12984_t:CDS:2 [Funneliformis mosseae]